MASYNENGGGGCGWGLIHVIKRHHWPHFMRRLAHHRRKRLVGNRGAAVSVDGMQEQDNLIVGDETAESVPRKNSSIKSRVRALLAEEVHKLKAIRHHQSWSKKDKINPNSQEEPTTSYESSTDYSKHEHQKKPSENSIEELIYPKPIRTSQSHTDSFHSRPKEYMDALDIISANEELLVKVMHDPGSPLAHHFRNLQALNTKRGLAKSETFPLLSSSEVHDNPGQDSSKTPKNHSETRAVTKRAQSLKQKIKHYTRENSKEMHRIAMDAIIHKTPHDQKIQIDSNQFKKFGTFEGQGKDSPGSSYGSDCSAPSFGKNKQRLSRMTRTFSVNESLDRYIRLHETSFGREAKSDTSSEGTRRTKAVPKYLARIYSLPDLKSYLSPKGESSDVFSSGMAVEADAKGIFRARRIFEEQMSEDSPLLSKYQLQTERNADEGQFKLNEINSATENEFSFISIANNESAFTIDYAMESIAEEDLIELSLINSATENKAALTSRENDDEKIECSSHMNESEAEPEVEAQLPIDEPDKQPMCDITNLEVKVKAKDKAEFSYVKDILELSGFSGEGLLGTWHSDHQLLNPSVYEEAEGCLVCDPDCSGKCDHPLLFDLINEVLMEIYGRSYSYYPFPLSNLSHMSPMPIGQHVLREVWGLISWYLSLRPEVDQSLDCVMESDLAKSSWWMNLQFDCECVGLELEDLIFEDLLEEIIWA